MSKQYEWEPVPGYEGLYDVSDAGEIRRRGSVQCRTLSEHRDGYKKVLLHKRGRMKTFSVHRLVASAFVANPGRHPQVNHIDGDKQNNRASNLEWCSAQTNVRHAVATGLFGSMGERHHLAKLDRHAAEFVRLARSFGYSLKFLAGYFGVSVSTISSAATYRTWKQT